MTLILIACIILAVGAAAEVIAYVFTAKLLKKKEDGLNRRKAALDALEDCIKPSDVPTFVTIRRNWKKYTAEAHIGAREIHTPYASQERAMAACADEARHKVCSNLFLHIPVCKIPNADNSITFRAELWVAEGGPDND